MEIEGSGREGGAGGEFPRGGKILVFIRLVPVLVTFDKNACYAFQARPGPERPSRESYANRSREFSLFALFV